jgi:hypothetical protein
VEGTEEAATNGEIALPQFDAFNRQSRYVDVFNRGTAPFKFSAVSDSPWIVLSEKRGKVEKDRRVWISVDWRKAPGGTSSGSITFSGPGAGVTVMTPRRPHAIRRWHMNMRLGLLGGGVVLLFAGIAFWVYGYNVEPTAGQAIGNIFSGNFTDRRNAFMLAGLIVGGVGAASLLGGVLTGARSGRA